MSTKALYILGILATIGLGTYFYNSMCCPYCEKTLQSDAPIVAQTDFKGMGNYNKFNISGKDITYTCHDNFRFLSNDYQNIQPVNDSINNGIGLLKTYFDKNKDKLIIISYALVSEKNTSAFPNLALARANNLKEYFVSKGIESNRFELKGELRDAWKINKDTVYGAADFKILEGEEIATQKVEDFTALKAKINANPLILYFQTNQTDVNLSVEDRQKVADLVRFLDNIAGTKLSVVGHTDNVGDRAINTKLGLGRAEFAKSYLSKNGISASKIVTSSKGPDEPIADNKTDEGKSKNRRTVVTIK